MIPSLAPGEEWRTFWDFMPAREKASLPLVYTGELTFKDYRGKKTFPSASFVIDLQVTLDRGFMNVYNMHHAADALREIKTMLSTWGEPDRTGLRVIARDGDRKDQRTRDQFESRRRED
jgi:hypothetical protein